MVSGHELESSACNRLCQVFSAPSEWIGVADEDERWNTERIERQTL
jgi:hypothetical protein